MIINLNTIENVPRTFDFNLAPDWRGWNGNDRIIALDTPLKCDITLVKSGIRYILDGKIHGYAAFTCDRCLESYQSLLDLEFRLFLSSPVSDPHQGELELSEEDLSVVFVKGDELDLGEIVREQIYLTLPMKSLCRKDCSGLCPVCGVKLSNQICNCARGNTHPELLKLKDLILNGEH